MDQLSRAGVYLLGDAACNPWVTNASALLAVIREYHGGEPDYRRLGPIRDGRDWRELRASLYAAAPPLEEFAEGLRLLLKSNAALLLPRLGLEAFSTTDRATLAYALGLCIGNPTATDKKQVIWDVQARQRDSTYFSTFSETDGEAAYHTDTQYYPEPEPFFALYCMTPARCGGGYSSVLDARALRGDIEKKHRWIAETLSTKLLPFRVPSAFVTTGDANTVQATLAPVFAQTPLIRYRRDTLAAGLHYFPEYGDADAHRALDALEHVLASCPFQAEFFMPKDSLVLIDNHRALHARTRFQDHERHLLRIRMRDDSTELASPRYGMVSREAESLSLDIPA